MISWLFFLFFLPVRGWTRQAGNWYVASHAGDIKLFHIQL